MLYPVALKNELTVLDMDTEPRRLVSEHSVTPRKFFGTDLSMQRASDGRVRQQKNVEVILSLITRKCQSKSDILTSKSISDII